jgi:hypothetical protein
MAICANCRAHFKGDELYCPPCEEHKLEVYKEIYGMFCTHCGKTFMPGEFERHKWQVHYRTGDFPKGNRVEL